MTFEETWQEVEKLGILPEAAYLDLPSSLTEETKRELSKRQVTEVAEIIMSAISEINNGSIETLNSLIQKRIGIR